MDCLTKDKIKEIYDVLLIGGYNKENKVYVNSEMIGYGSYYSKKLKYSADIDITENIKVNNNIKTIANRFSKMGEKIKNNNNFIFIKFRAGTKNKIDIGNINKYGRIENYDFDKIKSWINSQNLNKNIYDEIHKYLKKNISIEDFIKLKYIIVNIYRIDWTLDELIACKKNNIELYQKLTEDDTKIDIIYKCNNLNYIEAGNIYFFYSDNKLLNDYSYNRYESLYYHLIDNDYYKSLKLFRSILMDQNIGKNRNIIREDICKFLNSKYGYIGYLKNKLNLILKLLEIKEITNNDAKKIYINLMSKYINVDDINENKIKSIIEISVKKFENIINTIAKRKLKIYYNKVKDKLTFNIDNYL